VEIQGSGLLARAFAGTTAREDAVTIFAKGVADSTTTAVAEFERERRELDEAIRACQARGRTLVYLSGGGAIYGRRESVRSEDDALTPGSLYGRHQLTCEEAIRSSGVDHLIARIPNAVGHPQRPAQLVPSLVQQVQRGTVALREGASRDLIDAADVAELVVGLLDAGAREAVNVASGISTPVGDLVAHIERLLDTTAEHVVLDTEPDPQRFSIARLQSYLPSWSPGPQYPYDVLERYVRTAALDGG
jgi:nucleoside-diphosphate-sugar epimerase